ncbi:helix-turn-helix transcriptional regulator [Bradyrhizobium diazoefficiens]|uniref:helix-turn-helix transcriptional regulator n=1 Tax=Bradyrhizobium diazoefficiens TaxID=1355477 RepID=UPI0015B4B8B1|nr:hypothetical protein [Bradyrhizobium diazoefficiens]QLD40521.1 hypothetical protein HUW42_05700 [Bradyrhizobium diazoefficiens]
MVYKSKPEALAALKAAGIERDAFSIPETAAILGYSEGFLRNLIHRGEGPRVITAGARKIITTEDRQSWLRQRAAAAAS